MVRVKNRYFVVQVNRENDQPVSVLKMSASLLNDCIKEKVQDLYGDFGVAAIHAGFTAKYCNEYTRIAIIRARKGPHRMVAASVPCVKEAHGKPIALNILYVGSSMRHCFIFIKNYQEKRFNEFCCNLKTDEEKEEIRKILLNLDSVLNV
ncbi:ribonuclease P/MRP protein subunit POP5 [Aethina tumida]|uniref:ribonuclease P/MRP protein subunit POP5 n=1 Tax=Aethina tumida TaxID=116153 RepID=UPI00096B576C|nr:ribonuclease P/MRP protein subunit POP5 [Aethina tumida]